MKKYCRYLKIFTAMVVLLGLAVAARPGDTEAPEPNSPTEILQQSNPQDSPEPNSPIEDSQLSAQPEIPDPNTPAENLQSKISEVSTEPNTPIEDIDLTTQPDSPEPNAPAENRDPNTPPDSNEPDTPAELLRLIAEMESQEPNIPEDASRSMRQDYGRDQSYPAHSWDLYKIVVERNMFSRQRGPRIIRQRQQRTVPTLPPAPDPESYVVLKGIVQEDGEFIAFLEDTQSGQILRVRQGDSVVRGKIKSLSLDSIEYEFEDKTTTVTMGLNLQGGLDGTTFTGMYELSQIPSTTTEAGTTESSAPPSEDEAEILRQLMERRQQQVGN